MNVNEGTRKAQEIIKTHRYLYGGKGQRYTMALVERLAKAYPGKFTAALKAEAMKDADKGYLAGDCSYLVCSALGIPNINSLALKQKAVMLIRPQKALAEEGMVLWKSGHVAYIGDDLKVYEMRSTARDGCVSPFDERAKDFSYMFVIKDSPLYMKHIEELPMGNYYPKYKGVGSSIVSALTSVGEKDTSFAHRKQIAEKNGITGYRGTIAQNLKLVKLLKEGKLIK
jgi:hypothetical protein